MEREKSLQEMSDGSVDGRMS